METDKYGVDMHLRLGRPMYVRLRSFAATENKNVTELVRDICGKFLEEKDREAYEQYLDFDVGEEL